MSADRLAAMDADELTAIAAALGYPLTAGDADCLRYQLRRHVTFVD